MTNPQICSSPHWPKRSNELLVDKTIISRKVFYSVWVKLKSLVNNENRILKKITKYWFDHTIFGSCHFFGLHIMDGLNWKVVVCSQWSWDSAMCSNHLVRSVKAGKCKPFRYLKVLMFEKIFFIFFIHLKYLYLMKGLNDHTKDRLIKIIVNQIFNI